MGSLINNIKVSLDNFTDNMRNSFIGNDTNMSDGKVIDTIDYGDFEYRDGVDNIYTSQSDLDTYISELESNIDEYQTNIDNLNSEISYLNDFNNQEGEHFDSLRIDSGLSYDYDLQKFRTPEEYSYLRQMELQAESITNTIDEVQLERDVKEYTERYNMAVSSYTNGEASNSSEFSSLLSKKQQDLSTNQFLLHQAKQQSEVASFDSYSLTQEFNSNYDFAYTYQSKIESTDTEEYNLIINLICNTKDISNWHDMENYYREHIAKHGESLSAFDLLECVCEAKYGISPQNLRKLSNEEVGKLIYNLEEDGLYWAEQTYNIYKYMNDKQLAMYKTIFERTGSARDYYEAIEEDINSLQGLEDALGFFKKTLGESGYKLEDVRFVTDDEGKLSIYTLNSTGEWEENYDLTTNFYTLADSFFEGIGDGTLSFFEGFGNIFSSSDNRSRLDYKKMYVATFLENNAILKGTYDVGSGIGNMVPSIMMSTLLGGAGAPALIQENFGYLFMGLSTMGNEKKNYLVQGFDEGRALIGGLLKGSIEFITGKLLGRIPGLNNDADIDVISLVDFKKAVQESIFGKTALSRATSFFRATNWGKLMLQIADNMAHEGMEEFIQSYFETGVDAAITGNPTAIGETTQEALYSFLMGALTSGIMSSGQVVIQFDYAGAEYRMNKAEIQEFLNQNHVGNPTQDLFQYSVNTHNTNQTDIKGIDVALEIRNNPDFTTDPKGVAKVQNLSDTEFINLLIGLSNNNTKLDLSNTEFVKTLTDKINKLNIPSLSANQARTIQAEIESIYGHNGHYEEVVETLETLESKIVKEEALAKKTNANTTNQEQDSSTVEELNLTPTTDQNGTPRISQKIYESLLNYDPNFGANLFSVSTGFGEESTQSANTSSNPKIDIKSIINSIDERASKWQAALDLAEMWAKNRKSNSNGSKKECYNVPIPITEDITKPAVLLKYEADTKTIYNTLIRINETDNLIKNGLRTPQTLSYRIENEIIYDEKGVAHERTIVYELQERAAGRSIFPKINENQENYETKQRISDQANAVYISEISQQKLIDFMQNVALYYQNGYNLDTNENNYFLDSEGNITLIDLDISEQHTNKQVDINQVLSSLPNILSQLASKKRLENINPNTLNTIISNWYAAAYQYLQSQGYSNEGISRTLNNINLRDLGYDATITNQLTTKTINDKINQVKQEKIVVGEALFDDAATSRLITIGALCDIIQNEELFNKFLNNEFDNHYTKTNYYEAFVQLYQAMHKNNYDLGFNKEASIRLEQIYKESLKHVDKRLIEYSNNLTPTERINIMKAHNKVYDRQLLNNFVTHLLESNPNNPNIIFDDALLLLINDAITNKDNIDLDYSIYNNLINTVDNSLVKIAQTNQRLTREQLDRYIELGNIRSIFTSDTAKTYTINYLASYPSGSIVDFLKNTTYSEVLPERIKQQMIEIVNTMHDEYYQRNNDNNDNYGANQNATARGVITRIKNLDWLDSKQSFINYLTEYDKRIDKKVAKKFYNQLVNIIENNNAINAKYAKIVQDYMYKIAGETNSFDVMDKIYNTFEYKFASEEYKQLFNKLQTLGLSKLNAIRILSSLDSTGICSYAAFANEIFEYYKNEPNKFYHDFGYTMYIKGEDGKVILNSSELLLDMYDLYYDAGKQRTGTLFKMTADGKIEINELDTKQQIYMSKSEGTNINARNAFLKYKNINLESQEQLFKNFNPKNKTQLNREQVNQLKNNVIEYLKQDSKNSVRLGIYRTNDNCFHFNDSNGKTFITTETWEEGDGHAVTITGVEGDNFIVISWGKRLLIPISDFVNNNFSISFQRMVSN